MRSTFSTIFVASLLLLLLLAPSAHAGFTVCPACIAACLAAPPTCWGCIVAFCAASCFTPETLVTRVGHLDLRSFNASSIDISQIPNLHGPEEKVAVKHVRSGDVLLTLDPITKAQMATLVTSNEFIRQRKSFTTLSLQSGASLSVTSDHGTVVYRPGFGDIIVPASNVMVGDAIYSSNGKLSYVSDSKTSELEDRFALQTTHGTVLASDAYVGTMCGSELSHSLVPKLALWSQTHAVSSDSSVSRS